MCKDMDQYVCTSFITENPGRHLFHIINLLWEEKSNLFKPELSAHLIFLSFSLNISQSTFLWK